MGLSKPTINGWKTGKANPNTTSAMKVASYFNVSYEELFNGLTDVKEKPTAGAVSFEDVVKAVKSMDREQLVKLAIIIAQEQGER